MLNTSNPNPLRANDNAPNAIFVNPNFPTIAVAIPIPAIAAACIKTSLKPTFLGNAAAKIPYPIPKTPTAAPIISKLREPLLTFLLIALVPSKATAPPISTNDKTIPSKIAGCLRIKYVVRANAAIPIPKERIASPILSTDLAPFLMFCENFLLPRREKIPPIINRVGIRIGKPTRPIKIRGVAKANPAANFIIASPIESNASIPFCTFFVLKDSNLSNELTTKSRNLLTALLGTMLHTNIALPVSKAPYPNSFNAAAALPSIFPLLFLLVVLSLPELVLAVEAFAIAAKFLESLVANNLAISLSLAALNAKLLCLKRFSV